MRTPPLILIADDNPANVEIFEIRLSAQGYQIATATDGQEALDAARDLHPDLILLDVMMPKMDGIEVCQRIKGDSDLPFMPIVLVTAKSDPQDVVAGLEAGAEEYLTKPVDQHALVARVKSMLRIKELHDQTKEQSSRLEVQARELSEWNQTLEQRVADQVSEIERVGQLKRFFSPQLADLIVSSGPDEMIRSHRREITAVFCDLRGFTAFAETAEPEEVMRVIGEYHAAVGPLIEQYEATLEHFVGDGLMAFFNDPVPCDDPCQRAVRMAIAMQEAVGICARDWVRHGYELGMGIGIATGYATLGQIGFEGRFHYGAIGTVMNMASRLCDQASSGVVLASKRVAIEVEAVAQLEELDAPLALKGFSKPVQAWRVLTLKGS